MHDLLHDSLISVRLPRGETRLSLPELLAALARGEVLAYTRLRRHQADPFHVFTVQLAASILARRGLTVPPDDPGFWRAGLLELADGQACAWRLVERDPTKPAFMQSPCPTTQDFAAFKPKAIWPDELDVLVTAKDHDVKMARARSADPELWLAVLITYQSLSGFLGAGNYGVVRMNGGFASRTILSSVHDQTPGPRFLEELPIVLQTRANALDASFGYCSSGVLLTWLKPWNGREHQLSLSDCDPLFIEAPRRLRLQALPHGIAALGATSGKRQIAGPDNGDCGDPWTVLNVEDKKKGASALTVSGLGLTPKLLTDLLFQRGYRLSPLQQARPGTGGTKLCASVLVRGQGRTDGFHAVEINIPERARLALLRSAQRDQLENVAQEWLKDAAAGVKCLRGALLALAEGGPTELDYGKESVSRWADHAQQEYTLAWRDDYFPTLWLATEPDARLNELRAAWARSLMERARRVLSRAEQTLPIPAARRLRARIRAEGLMENLFRKYGLADSAKEGKHDVVA
jgi:CRISPR system Cascade subunit CasA